MIPDLVEVDHSPWKLLPAGVHVATLEEVRARYATSPVRRKIFEGFYSGCYQLKIAGAKTVYLDGSFVTGKPIPGDFDSCWEPAGVDVNKLNPVFRDFRNKRAAQKREFEGEFFPLGLKADGHLTFLQFFQVDKYSGERKGIIKVNLELEPFDRIGGGV